MGNRGRLWLPFLLSPHRYLCQEWPVQQAAEQSQHTPAGCAPARCKRATSSATAVLPSAGQAQNSSLKGVDACMHGVLFLDAARSMPCVACPHSVVNAPRDALKDVTVLLGMQLTSRNSVTRTTSVGSVKAFCTRAAATSRASWPSPPSPSPRPSRSTSCAAAPRHRCRPAPCLPCLRHRPCAQ